MVMSKLLLEYKDEALLSLICKPLKTLLLAVSKYNTLPVGIIQFLISKINLQPTLILSVYDDKRLLSSLCKTNTFLDTAMVDSSLDVVNPTVLVFPTSIPSSNIIYSYSERYYYSSAYLIYLKLGSDIEKKLQRYALYSSSERSQVMCNLEFCSPCGILKLPDLPNLSIKLPFRNFIKNNKLYEPIIKSFMEEKMYIVSQDEIENIFTTIKENQTYKYNEIQLFKDFFKLKPLTLTIYSTLDTGSENPVRSVCLKMDFNTKLTHIVFYRYIEGVVNRIIGTIDEASHE